MNSVDVDVARLEEKFLALREKIDKLEDDVTTVSGKLDTVLEALTEAKGGWKTLMMVGGAAAALASGISWILAHVSFK